MICYPIFCRFTAFILNGFSNHGKIVDSRFIIVSHQNSLRAHLERRSVHHLNLTFWTFWFYLTISTYIFSYGLGCSCKRCTPFFSVNYYLCSPFCITTYISDFCLSLTKLWIISLFQYFIHLKAIIWWTKRSISFY